jgi:(1->4)-alpha-D-glucan 1-alpha-D-glucosylmutase
MTTLSTHDTKRSDDVRARLAVISEVPGQWRQFLRRWSRQNMRLKTNGYPDRNTEYFLYQTLIGAWPIEPGRFTAYMEKAVREAKQQTSWTQQNKQFEDALRSFTDRLFELPEFLSAIEDFVKLVLAAGRINSLAQTLLKCTAPGVPDTYQGGELWDLHLVDPDNRGPVDYEARRSLLSQLQSGMPIAEIVRGMDSGMPKMWVLHRAFNLRKQRPEWFDPDAGYTPLIIAGRRADHAIAYLRGDAVATIVPRWNLKLGGNWSGTTLALPSGSWRNLLSDEVLSGGTTPLQSIFRQFPVALLQKEEG